MREYTAKEMKLLKANPYTFKVTKNKLYFTIEFKEAFWTAYQAGFAPRKILQDLGYDLEMFGQKQIDSMVQSIKRQAQDGNGFREGEDRSRRKKSGLAAGRISWFLLTNRGKAAAYVGCAAPGICLYLVLFQYPA